jgi:two-component system response regulator ChvI
MVTLRGFTGPSTFRTGSPVPDPVVPIKTKQSCRIIIVDDDEDYRCALRMHLANEGFDVVECTSGLSALEMTAAYETANVVLMDWRMRDMNGLEVLCELRRRAVATPVIFLTGFADETLEEAAIAAGAADFMQKSRGLSVLGRRIELAAEGRRPRSQPPLFRLGPLKLRFDTSRAFWHGSEIDLTLTEFRMVSKLALEAGQEVTYRELYDLVHGKDFVTGYNELGTLRTCAPPLSASGGNFRRSTLRSPASKPAKGTDTSGSINSDRLSAENTPIPALRKLPTATHLCSIA